MGRNLQKRVEDFDIQSQRVSKKVVMYYEMYWKLIMEFRNQKRARLEYTIFKNFTARIKKYIRETQGKMVLDVGCGFPYPQTLLHHSYGNRIIGIDIADVKPSLRRTLVTGGAKPHTFLLLARTFYKMLYNRVLHKILDSVATFSITTKNIDVRTIDATDMPFPDEMFDIVISTTTFEHVLDVPRAISEVKRVMRKGAIAHIGIHLFTSLSGGHNIETGQIPIVDLPKHVRPWDHLRKRPILPIPAKLNR